MIFTGIPNVDACITGKSGQLKPSTVSYTDICNSLPITVFLFWASQPFPALSVFRFYTHLPFHICFSPPTSSFYLCPSLFHPVFSFSLYPSGHSLFSQCTKKAELPLFTFVSFWFTGFDLKLIGVTGVLNSTGFGSRPAARLVLKSLCKRNSSACFNNYHALGICEKGSL